MAKITELPAAGPITGTDTLPIVQGAGMFKTPVNALMAAIEAELQPLVDAAEAARDAAISVPIAPTITALEQAVSAGAETLDGALDYVRSSLRLAFADDYYRSGTSVASTLTTLNVLDVTQAATTYAPGTGTFASFAANTPRVTNRGLLIASAATNSFTYSNDFSNAIWLKLNLNTTAGQTDPLGGTTATKLTPTVTSGVHRLRNEILGATTNGRVVNLSYRFKADGYSQVRIYAVANSGFVGTFDLSAGTVTSTGGVNGGTAPTTATITAIGGGFYDIIIGGTFNSANTGQTLAVSILVLSGGNETFAGDGTSGVVLWEASGPEGGKGVIPTSGAPVTRAADAALLDLLPGADDDAVIVAYEGGEATIHRSDLASPTALNLATDASAPWLDKFITKIELLPAAVSAGNALAAIKNAVRNYALFPRPAAALAANDTPTLTLGTAGAASLINGAATNAPNLPRTDSKITYVSGVPMTFGTIFPRTIFYTSRGAFYGWGDAGGTVPVRGTGYFAYEIVHTGTEFDIPVLGNGSGGTNFRLLVNGCEAGTVAVPNSTGAIYYLRVVFPASGTRTIRVETAGVPCNGFNAASTSEFSSVARSYPLVTMIGDSFVEGSGAAMGDMESVVLLRGLGFNAAPAGVGSTGLINPGGNNTSGFPKVPFWHPERLKDLTLSGVTSAQTGAAVSPAMGVVCGSLNDQSVSSGVWSAFGATLTDAIENRAQVMIDAWVSAHPGKPLVFFGPIWPSGLPDNRPPIQIYQIRDGYQQAAAARFADNVWFIDRMANPRREGLYSNAGDQASLYTGGTTGTDPTHPTPAGHRFDGLTDAAELRSLIMREL